jgi:hypothetical protein
LSPVWVAIAWRLLERRLVGYRLAAT